MTALPVERRASAAISAHFVACMDPRELHLALTRFARERLEPSLPDEPPCGAEDVERLRGLEAGFLESERDAVAQRAAEAPQEPDTFVEWFESLRENGPGQGDPLFPWLAQTASLAQMTWFLAQEVAGEAGFDDLIALTQIKMPVQAKIELARNYWDEMGRGRAAAMHGPLLSELARTLGVRADPKKTVWESLALANLLVGLALDRRYAYHSIGALGAIELTAPGRVALVDQGLARLAVAKAARRYFTLHATLDLQHSEAWNREVIRPLVAQEPRAAKAIAEGALMRLRAGERCFARYRRDLGLEPAEASQEVAFTP
jgi:hypothetical protein